MGGEEGHCPEEGRFSRQHGRWGERLKGKPSQVAEVDLSTAATGLGGGDGQRGERRAKGMGRYWRIEKEGPLLVVPVIHDEVPQPHKTSRGSGRDNHLMPATTLVTPL